jgi:ribonuclease R
LLRTHWKPTPTVVFQEQPVPDGWAALCVVIVGGKEQCASVWSVAQRKALAQQESAYRWLEAWVWGKLVTPVQAALPEAKPVLSVETGRPAPEPLLSTHQTPDYVSALNQHAQRLGVPLPAYSFALTPVPSGLFQCVCEYLDLVGKGEGTSKKQAKHKAAQSVWMQVERG